MVATWISVATEALVNAIQSAAMGGAVASVPSHRRAPIGKAQRKAVRGRESTSRGAAATIRNSSWTVGAVSIPSANQCRGATRAIAIPPQPVQKQAACQYLM